MSPTRAYILAGGRSSRFGSDKARAEIDGIPLIVRIADRIGDVIPNVSVVADAAGKYDDLGLRTVADRTPGSGPLGGLDTALHDAVEHAEHWVFLASCDLIDLKRSWIETLREQCAPPAAFVAFRGERWEPMFACYHVSLLPRITENLRDGLGAMWKLLDSSQGVVLPMPSDWPAQVQANTPAELAAAVAQLKKLPTDTASTPGRRLIGHKAP